MRIHVHLLLGGLLLAALAPARAAGQPPGLTIQLGPGAADFLLGKELVGRYHYGDLWGQAKPILWPLNAPGGTPVTRAWPMGPAPVGGSKDHPHQKSAWFCHGDVIPEGIDLKDRGRGVKGVDFWSETKGHGRIVCTVVASLKPEGGAAQLRTHNEWRTADGVKIMDEDRTITAYDLGAARLFVFDVDLVASVCPIIFGDTKEGAMGVRVSDAIRENKPGNGTLSNAEGKQHENNVWGRRSPWCDCSGKVDGRAVGIALFDDPKNPYPASWHARAYGLLAANPFGRAHSGFPAVKGRNDLVRLARGQHLRLRYGILVHEGDAETGQVAQLFRRFVDLRNKE
jgi:hypothetical protein